MAEPSYHVWVLQDFDTGANHVFDAEHLAMRAAERIVGNRSAARLGAGNVMLYGPGDGSTRVKIERVRREVALHLGIDCPP